MISNWIEIEDDDYIMDMKINESWRISTLTTKEIQMMIGRTWNKNYLILTKKYLVASYSQLKDKTPWRNLCFKKIFKVHKLSIWSQEFTASVGTDFDSNETQKLNG